MCPLQVVTIRKSPSRLVPEILEQSLRRLDLELETEGIFRLSGNQVTISKVFSGPNAKMRAEYEQGQGSITQSQSVHDVTGIMKLYLRELPEPVIPFDYYDRVIQCHNEDQSIMTANIKHVITDFPVHNLAVLAMLMRFLAKTATYEELNKMVRAQF